MRRILFATSESSAKYVTFNTNHKRYDAIYYANFNERFNGIYVYLIIRYLNVSYEIFSTHHNREVRSFIPLKYYLSHEI